MDKDVNGAFTPRLVVSFCSARAANSYLAQTGLCPFYRKVG